MWTIDPRSPLQFYKKTRETKLVINENVCVLLHYCPFCGKALNNSEHKIQKEHKLGCDHLKTLAEEMETTVRYQYQEMEYWLHGCESLMIRMFYCPMCGFKLPLHQSKTRFLEKSNTEIAQLKKRVKNLATIDSTRKLLGPPDVERGPVIDRFYPKGKLVRIGYRKVLFYNNLAKTITVQVVELLNRKIEVRLIPKKSNFP
jgi:predicted RNA-binding Zn-ribbon protein involved in translation (DUF1610 family)